MVDSFPGKGWVLGGGRARKTILSHLSSKNWAGEGLRQIQTAPESVKTVGRYQQKQVNRYRSEK